MPTFGILGEYRPLPEYLTIKESGIDGLGLHAKAPIKASWYIGKTHYHIREEWVRTPIGGFVNHSDTPNCVIIDNTNGENMIRELWTVRPIEEGEELSVFYTLSDETIYDIALKNKERSIW